MEAPDFSEVATAFKILAVVFALSLIVNLAFVVHLLIEAP